MDMLRQSKWLSYFVQGCWAYFSSGPTCLSQNPNRPGSPYHCWCLHVYQPYHPNKRCVKHGVERLSSHHMELASFVRYWEPVSDSSISWPLQGPWEAADRIVPWGNWTTSSGPRMTRSNPKPGFHFALTIDYWEGIARAGFRVGVEYSEGGIDNFFARYHAPHTGAMMAVLHSVTMKSCLKTLWWSHSGAYVCFFLIGVMGLVDPMSIVPWILDFFSLFLPVLAVARCIRGGTSWNTCLAGLAWLGCWIVSIKFPLRS